MNKVIVFSELCGSIAELTQCPAEDAANFVSETFRLAAEILDSEGRVEIPGIGVFMVTEDSVAYAPDSSLAEELNAPFAMFEAIELPDETDEPTSAETDEEQIAEAAEFEEAEDAEPMPEAEPETEAESEPVVETEPVAEAVPEPETEAEAERESRDETPQPPAYHPPRKAGVGNWVWFAWMISCIVCLAIGWFARGFAPQTVEPVVEPVEDVKNIKVSNDPNDVNDLKDFNDVSDESEAKEPETVTDTIAPGHFLTTMARNHYGRMEFWVYIYEANADKLGHPDRLSAGTVVVIPSAESLGLDASDPAQIAAAEAKAAEIYGRFN